MPEKCKVVIYARYSSSNQREESIAGQIRICTDYAEKMGYQIVNTYADSAISGTTDDRPEFQRMIIDAERHLFDKVLCYKVDRFSRNKYDSVHYKHKLKAYGIGVEYATESIPDGPEGIIFESLLEGWAQYYSEVLSQNVRRGMMENALEGKINSGHMAYGLINDHGYYALDPVTSPIVQNILMAYYSGRSVESIRLELADKGIKTRDGNPFTYNTLYTMLRNEKYAGIYIYKDIYHLDKIPQLVSYDIFCAIQVRLDHNPRASSRQRVDDNYLLSLKIFCGKCGSLMRGMCGTSRSGTKHYYYACGNKRSRKGCKAPNVRRNAIDELVIRQTLENILTDDMIDRIADMIMDMQSADKSSYSLKALEQSLASTNKSIKNILVAIEEGIFTPSTKGRLLELEAQRDELELSIIREQIVSPTVSRDFVIYYISRFKAGDYSDLDVCRSLVDTFVNAVYVYENKILIIYNYTDNDPQPITPPDFQKRTNFSPDFLPNGGSPLTGQPQLAKPPI